MERDLISVPVDPTRAAIALQRHGDYRVLRRMETMLRLDLPSTDWRAEDERLSTGIALDIETTGLDVGSSRIIELALQRFRFDDLGRIVATGQPRSWLEDPGRPLTRKVAALTNLTDADLAGRAIADAEAVVMIASASVIVAHNAAFDRPFVERRLPSVAGRRWMCSMADVDWSDLGFDGRGMGYLLAQCGWFYDAHRAMSDVTALLHLLDHRLDTSGTVLRELVRSASRSTWLVEAVGAKFEVKDVLRSHGYRWQAAKRVWTKQVGPDDLDEELEWATVEIYGGAGRPKYSEITWEQRYAEQR